jgi:hypothetical protein
MKLTALGIILVALVLSAPLTVHSFQYTQSESPTSIEEAVGFLLSQFNATLGLCREAPNAAPNTYWLVSDNLWALKALTLANESGLSNAAMAETCAETINASLHKLAAHYHLPTDSKGLPISYAHEAVIGDVAPPPYHTTTTCILYENDYVLKTAVLNGTAMPDWTNYTDLLLYAALSYHWQGNDSAAITYYSDASKMWNNTAVGFQDQVANITGLYDAYKLALFLYTSKVLGENPPFEPELVERIYAQQRESDGGIVTDYYANGTTIGDANTETTAIAIIALLTPPNAKMGTFAFYYPWYGTRDHSGYWHGWNDSGHNPDNITDGMRDIAAIDYPLYGVYDSNNETVINQQIEWAKNASITCFVISWWGINDFTDNASKHIVNVCQHDDFNFTFYIENTTTTDQAVRDINYLVSTYGNSSAWYRVSGRPVLFIYQRARDELNPQAWAWHACTNITGIDSNPTQNESASLQWLPAEEVRKMPRLGIIPFQPFKTTPGYVETARPINLKSNEQYWLNVGVSDIRNDSGLQSQVGIKVKIGIDPTCSDTLYNKTLHFSEGWQDLNFDITRYAGKAVYLRAESYAVNWTSEWAAVDYFFINDSKGEIVSPDPFFDNGWKDVISNITERGVDPYVIMDFGGYDTETKVQDFMEYFSRFIDGTHMYNPLDFSNNILKVYDLYQEACQLAHSYGKTFTATVVPGFNNVAISSNKTNALQHAVDRRNGATYNTFWLAAKAVHADGYAITSFNEWHEGTEIEPSIQYGYQYINLTRDNIPIVSCKFPPVIILPVFIATSLLLIAVRRKRKPLIMGIR